MIKIAILNKYQFSADRGSETFVADLSKRLSQKFNVDVIAKVNYREILKRKYDLIIPTNGRFQAILIRMIAWLSHAKVIISGQSGIGLDDRINLYTFPDAFIGLTDYQSKWAKKVNPFVKIKTIPNGVDLTAFKGEHLKGKKDYILAVGAFTKEKRHELTIKAVAKMKNAHLVIAGGGGDQRDSIEELCKELLPGRYKIISVSHDNMPQVYKNASVLVFPTVTWESFGIVMLEAMATGVPVVAVKDPIRQEIIGDAGLLVNPADIDKYKKTIEAAIEKDWQGKQRIQAEKFSWDKIAMEYEDLIKELISKE